MFKLLVTPSGTEFGLQRSPIHAFLRTEKYDAATVLDSKAISFNAAASVNLVEWPTSSSNELSTELGFTKYFRSNEVDQSARPIEDWTLDLAALPKESLCKVTIMIWISAEGEIDRWQIENQTPIGSWAQTAFSNLKKTPMQAAQKNGLFVPNLVRLEIAFDTHVQ